ncbi:SDR family oxidoreductase [Modestobacter altitudinis]|uniref:SDR family oxidoreductase n=1 Tax=Modestobacter altitudinis TaxID=2213158 RepID=UPI00110D0B24|nr:SDR family oxidoreductase [Modestobacter altitudinis]
MADQFTFSDPTTLYRTGGYPEQHQDAPGLAEDLAPGADHGEQSYRGTQQLAPRGIRVNVVAPGPFWTPLQATGGQPPEALPEFGKETPLGRAGQPAELGPAHVFLASPESSYVTGETLNVNGGMPTP